MISGPNISRLFCASSVIGVSYNNISTSCKVIIENGTYLTTIKSWPSNVSSQIRSVSKPPQSKDVFRTLRNNSSIVAAADNIIRSSKPVVICGPSGVGKSTIIHKLINEVPGVFGFSVSHTTRHPRDGEVDGVNYHFITR